MPPCLVHFAQLVPVFQKSDNSGGSRPSDKGGGGDPEIRKGDGPPQSFFAPRNLVPRAFPLKMGGAPHPFFKGKALGTRLRPSGPPFGLKIREGSAPQLVSLKPLVVSDLSGG